MILTHGYWQRRLGGAENVVGQQLIIDGMAAEVMGVLPASFKFLRMRPAIVLPMPLDVNAPRGISFGFQALARMKPGVTLAQANADVARRPLLVDLVPCNRAPCGQPVAHRLEIPRPMLLNRRSLTIVPSGSGNVPGSRRSCPLSSPSIVMEEERPTEVTPGTRTLLVEYSSSPGTESLGTGRFVVTSRKGAETCQFHDALRRKVSTLVDTLTGGRALTG